MSILLPVCHERVKTRIIKSNMKSFNRHMRFHLISLFITMGSVMVSVHGASRN